MPPIVIAIVDDLMTLSRLESAAPTLQLPKGADELREAIAQAAGGSALLLIGLASTRQPWESLVPLAQSSAAESGVELRVIGFGPHMDLTLRQRALDAGIQEVWANSRLMTDLPGLLS